MEPKYYYRLADIEDNLLVTIFGGVEIYGWGSRRQKLLSERYATKTYYTTQAI